MMHRDCMGVLLQQNKKIPKIVDDKNSKEIVYKSSITGFIESRLLSLYNEVASFEFGIYYISENTSEKYFSIINHFKDIKTILFIGPSKPEKIENDNIIVFNISFENLIDMCKLKFTNLENLYAVDISQNSEFSSLITLESIELPVRFRHKTLFLCSDWERKYFLDYEQGSDFASAFTDRTIMASATFEEVRKGSFKEIVSMRNPLNLKKFVGLCEELGLKLSVFNTEQCTVPNIMQKFVADLKSLSCKVCIYDFSQVNIDIYRPLLNNDTLKFVHLPYQASNVAQLALMYSKTQPKTFDFAHCGVFTDYRKTQIELVRQKGYTVNIIQDKWALERDLEIVKCAALLNIHQSEHHKIYESCRCDRLLKAGIPVYSQECMDPSSLPFNLKKISQIDEFIYDISILIPTMPSRRFVLDKLLNEINRQIEECSRTIKIEVLIDCDEGQKSVGKKRNDLLKLAKGKYSCFIDDDDFIALNYLKSFESMIFDGTFDSSSLWGSYYNKNIFQKRIHHSVNYLKWSETSDTYLRCPNHLNLIRTSIAKSIGYADKRFAEDCDFSMRLLSSKLIKKEFQNPTNLYFYLDEIKSIRNFCEFSFIDDTRLLCAHKWPKILLKMPSRSRPNKLLNILKKYITMSTNNKNLQITYFITIDNDDLTMTEDFKREIKNLSPDVILISGTSKGKIDACNRDMSDEIVNNNDIFMLASDDMVPVKDLWADIIVQKFHDVWPNFDGVIHFNDGFTNEKLDTFCIMGQKYYKQFNYFYYPEYISLWCDNEFTLVAKKKQKYVYDPLVLFRHEHPSNLNFKVDELYNKNERFFLQDQALFNKRQINF